MLVAALSQRMARARLKRTVTIDTAPCMAWDNEHCDRMIDDFRATGILKATTVGSVAHAEVVTYREFVAFCVHLGLATNEMEALPIGQKLHQTYCIRPLDTLVADFAMSMPTSMWAVIPLAERQAQRVMMQAAGVHDMRFENAETMSPGTFLDLSLEYALTMSSGGNNVMRHAQRVHRVFSDPRFSPVARVTSIIILLLIFLSSTTFIVESMPAYRKDVHGDAPQPGDGAANRAFDVIEIIAIVVFTVEYVARFISSAYMPSEYFLSLYRDGDVDVIDWRGVVVGSGGDSGQSLARHSSARPSLSISGYQRPRAPNRYRLRQLTRRQKVTRFALQSLNLVDLFSILPFYVEVALGSSSASGFTVLRVLRLARIFRIFKLGRYSSHLMLFAKVIRRSRSPLILMLFCVSIAVVLFSTAVYAAEVGSYDETLDMYTRQGVGHMPREESPFRSIPASMWFVISTLTSTGYGDLVPTSGVGKLVSTFAIYLGVLVLALPVSIIGANFAVAQAEEQQERELNAARCGELTDEDRAQLLEARRRVDRLIAIKNPKSMRSKRGSKINSHASTPHGMPLSLLSPTSVTTSSSGSDGSSHRGSSFAAVNPGGGDGVSLHAPARKSRSDSKIGVPSGGGSNASKSVGHSPRSNQLLASSSSSSPPPPPPPPPPLRPSPLDVPMEPLNATVGHDDDDGDDNDDALDIDESDVMALRDIIATVQRLCVCAEHSLAELDDSDTDSDSDDMTVCD